MSKKRRTIAKNKRGVTLIMVAGVLAVLAALSTGFYFMMLSGTKSAIRYSDFVRADLVAKAGIQFSIGQLRAQAFKKTEDAGSAWYQVDYLRGASKRISYPYSTLIHDGIDNDADGEADNPEEALLDPALMRGFSSPMGSSAGKESDRFSLNIQDAAGKININAGDNLAVMLDNLCRAIGSPLVAANLDALQPRRWAEEADGGDPIVPEYSSELNKNDTAANLDIYFSLTNNAGKVMTDGTGRPMRGTDGVAVYGDGYAIAGYRSRHGAFQNPEDIKAALTYVERNSNSIPDDPLERLEIEVKFAAIRDHITTSSWVDTNTVCVGKFEWIHVESGLSKTIAIDRDKSWVVDDLVNDPLNHRGSLRGCYLSIMNGHGAGQLRRIRTNGADWIEVENGFAVTPGPISSYMIVSNEEAMLMDVDGKQISSSYPDKPPAPGTVTFPMTKPDGTFIPNPKMDYSLHPLCIHRAPVNVNTATDKVLVALLLGINIQHGHPLALGTDADVEKMRTKWKKADIHKVQPYLLTPAGLKRIPAATGKPVLNRVWGAGVGDVPLPPASYNLAYLNNYDTLGAPNFVVEKSGYSGLMNEAHELAYRILMSRQSDRLQPALKYVDPKTGGPTAVNSGLLRGPFRTWDELYFRVIKPWDDVRFNNGWIDKNNDGLVDGGDEFHSARLANMLMAHFNSNTDILKFNPNIEWIDRWSRNFTEQEPVMVYTNETAPGNGIFETDVESADPISAASTPIYTAVLDPKARGWSGNAPPLKSSQKDLAGQFIKGAYITRGYRYKSDELIDKTDLNRSTTEFSFDSNGTFEIVSTGQVTQTSTVLAERKFVALIKVYDVWRESTQQQFVMGTISEAVGNRKMFNNSAQLSCTGQLARDASGSDKPKGLVTLPEPLLPLKARIRNIDGQPNPRNKEVVTGIASGDDTPLDAFGRPRQNPYDSGARPIDVPDVLANRVLPARYDGQITLATNTSSYNNEVDKDTFLASFDGDLDTADCEGNGREQAKWPYSAEPDGAGSFKYTGNGHKHRCVQSIGLLGVLYDTLVASDPGIPLVDGVTPYKDAADKGRVRWIYPFFGVSTALTPLKLGSDPDRPSYWNNVTLRMGALRTDGAYLTAPGVSGNNATVKYLYSPSSGDRHKKLNFQPDSPDGNVVTMWAKTVWHHDDMRNHEFFNPGNASKINQCVGYNFQKMGQYKWCSNDAVNAIGHCGNRRELNDLFALMMYQHDSGYGTGIHGGYAGVNANQSPDESPGYRVQPFRWSFVGIRTNYGTKPPCPESIGPKGHLASNDDYASTSHNAINKQYLRPFIDTSLNAEVKANWEGANPTAVRLRWSYRAASSWGTNKDVGITPRPSYQNPNNVGDARDVISNGSAPTSVAKPNPTLGGRMGEGQDAKWVWADPYGKLPLDPDKTSSSLKSFGMNNLNFGNPVYDSAFDVNRDWDSSGTAEGSCELFWHYRHMPEDGTYAVIDELKLSNKDRVIVDSGADWPNDRVVREMQTSRYYLPPNPGTRQSPDLGGPPTFTSQTLLQSLKGFDKVTDSQNITVIRVSWNVFTPRFMCEYKTPEDSPFQRNENLTRYTSTSSAQAQVPIKFKGPFDYVKYNDNTDVTPYSVNRPAPWEYKAGLAQSGRGVEIELLKDGGAILGGKTFTDPAAINSLGKSETPVLTFPSQLRYRVRFCYPVDPLVDPTTTTTDAEGKPRVNPAKQYLLDTPVFDDISVTYMLPPRILAYREVTE